MADVGGADLDLMLAELDVKKTQIQLNVKSGIVSERRHQAEINKIVANRVAAEESLAEIEAQIEEINQRVLERDLNG